METEKRTQPAAPGDGAALRITAPKLGLAYAGCFLGVGYLSGQELWTFFGGRGVGGFVGAALVIVLQYVSGVLLVRLVQRSGVSAVDELVVRHQWPWLRRAVAAVQCMMMFFAMTVMVAGSGAMLAQLLALPAWLGSALFGLLIGYVAYRGLGALLRVFSVTVPALTVVCVAVCAAALLRVQPPATPPVMPPTADPVMTRWYGAATLFFSYNMFASVGVLSPLGSHLRDPRVVRRGILLGAAVLALVTFGVLTAMTVLPESAAAELPMLAVAGRVAPVLSGVFAVLLLGGMFGTASNCSLYVVNFLTTRFALVARRRLLTVCALLGCGFLISLFGFSGLIGTMYPIFGYFGVVMFAGLVEHYLHCLRRGE